MTHHPMVELSTETVMRLNNGDLERCYQLVLKRIAQYDLGVKDDPEYRQYLSKHAIRIMNEMVRRRWLVHF